MTGPLDAARLVPHHVHVYDDTDDPGAGLIVQVHDRNHYVVADVDRGPDGWQVPMTDPTSTVRVVDLDPPPYPDPASWHDDPQEHA